MRVENRLPALDSINLSDFVHCVEDVLMGVNLHAKLLTILIKQVDERLRALIDVYQHDHCKYIVHYILRNVDDVDLMS